MASKCEIQPTEITAVNDDQGDTKFTTDNKSMSESMIAFVPEQLDSTAKPVNNTSIAINNVKATCEQPVVKSDIKSSEPLCVSGSAPPLCSWCYDRCHVMKACPQFIEAKKATTTIPYYSNLLRMRSQEVDGFASAGIMLLRRGQIGNEMLMIMEHRDNHHKCNFIGGKRDHKGETPRDTAIREFNEETSQYINFEKRSAIFDNTNFCVWYPKSKYVLFVTIVKEDITVAINSPLVWVPPTLAKFNMHSYVLDMLNDVSNAIL